MARIRSVKPDLFASYTLASVPVEARFLFIALFTEADDEGRLIDSPKRIAGAVFPHDEKITERNVDRWLAALAEVGCIVRYAAESGRYIAMPKWSEHQKISHASPSKLPSPSGDVPEGFRPDLGTGNREQGEGEGGGESPPPPAPARSRRTPIPTGPIPTDRRAWAVEHGYGEKPIDALWERMLRWHRREGKRSADWAATWESWLASEFPDVAEGRSAEAIDVPDRQRVHELRQLRSRLAAQRKMLDPDPDEIAELETAIRALGADP